MKEKVQTLKETFAMLREAIIVLLFLFLLIWPSAFKNKLVDMGFSKLEFMGMNMDLQKQIEETANAGKQVANMQLEVNGLKSVIDSVQRKSSNPEEKKMLSALSSKTEKLFTATNIIDNNLKQQMITQQDVIQEKMNVETPTEGWIYAGKLRENKTDWDLTVTPTIAERKANYQTGEMLTIIDDVYLRNNSSPLTHANAQVIAVLKKGESISYLDNDFSHSVGGGWFLWLKVKRNIKS